MIGFAILAFEVQRDRLRLDGNSTFLLQIHRVEHLGGHFTIRQATTDLDKPVCQRRLSMVDVSNDRKVSDVILHNACVSCLSYCPGKYCWD